MQSHGEKHPNGYLKLHMHPVRIIALGGVGEIGKNCTVVEQGDDLILIDCGLSFPNEEMLGVDIVVPDFTYLVENKDRLKGIFLTHAHEDHVGGLPYLLSKLDAPVYCTEFTQNMIRSRLEERLPNKKIIFNLFKPGDIMEVGALSVEAVRITHSIPENCGMAVRTQHGIIFFTGDFKFDFTPVDNKLTNMARLGELGDEGVVILLSDSTNVERPGWGPSERVVIDGIRSVVSQAEGRVLMTTFASNIHRMQQLFEVAAEAGRKVAVVGRRMEQTLEICTRMGIIKIPKDVWISLQDMKMFPDHQLCVLTTGSQGEPMSALVQMSKGSYGRLQIRPGDTLIYSARPIPGNEGAIWRTVNRLIEQGCHVIYDHPTPVHVSGHAYQEELKMMINLTRPFYVAPVHGEPRHQAQYNKIASKMGYPEHRRFTMRAGVPLEITDVSAEYGEPVTAGRVLIDNGGHHGVSDEVLRDRYNIANDGLVVITLAIDVTKGEIVGDPVLHAKAFSGRSEVLDKCYEVVYDAIQNLSKEEKKDIARVRHDANDVAKRFLLKHTGLRPMVLPVIIEV